MADELVLQLDCSDDDVPEEVTFQASEAAARRSMAAAMEATRREKELLKERRRKRQQLFLEQKKQCLLPAELLEKMDTGPSQTHKPPEVLEEKQKDTEEDEEMEMKGNVRNLKDGYTVMRPKDLASSQQQVALDFLQSRLHGPGIRRISSNQLLSLQNKRGDKKSAAVQFVRRDWGSKHKAKAEKLKRRWLHKRQIDST